MSWNWGVLQKQVVFETVGCETGGGGMLRICRMITVGVLWSLPAGHFLFPQLASFYPQLHYQGHVYVDSNGLILHVCVYIYIHAYIL